ncbi:hypothetical protein [Limnobacter sp. P1]|uniref:hypothetical protein n=1 Tax=Limnobacter olei TaxID=3031298 RepID=UPI0023AF17E9|nr:hypothetical protein [Limnobacter sp. P1]
MKSSKERRELAALRIAAIDDLLAMTDEELRLEALADGVDLEAAASEVGAGMQKAAAAALRHRLALAKGRVQSKASPEMALTMGLPIERIKQIVQSVFQSDASLGLAFREGKKQTDEDWRSLYDDLVAMGAIKSNLNEH